MSIHLKSLVQAPKKKDYAGKVLLKDHFSIAPQIESQYSFEGNWFYIWLKKGIDQSIVEVGDLIDVNGTKFMIKEKYFYKNYKRGLVLLG